MCTNGKERQMSKKKDPNIVVRDKRLRTLAQSRKKTSKEMAKFGCTFFDRMVDEYYDLAERMIKIEHFVWKIENKDDAFAFGEFTDAAKALDKKDRDLIVRQYKHMAGYRDTLERRMDRVCERLVSERKETKRPDSKEK